ncbi:MAG: GAF domain-containing protein [Chloroflexota bacterium]
MNSRRRDEMIKPENSAPIANIESYVGNAYAAIWILLVAAAPAIVIFLYFGFVTNQWQLFVIAGAVSLACLATIPPYRLIKNGMPNRAMGIIIAQLIGVLVVISLLVEGLGVIISLAALITTIAIASLAMRSKYSLAGIFIGISISLMLYVADLNIHFERLSIPGLSTYTPIINVFLAIPFLFLGLRQFNNFSLRVKIATGILVTGGLAVITLLYFGLNAANTIVGQLTGKFEESVTDQTEAEIQAVVQSEADEADEIFLEAQSHLMSVAQYRTRIEKQPDLFNNGTYWNSSEKIFQLPGGQYGNSSLDPASIFIPNTYIVDETMLAEMNTTAYLDFVAPEYLETHPEVAAVYYISKLGYTTYYPNINLAEEVPADFDPTSQPFFTIANPQNNPDRIPRWTDPYQDPAGAGLIVTLSIPIYSRTGTFMGVVSADIQLSKVSQSISTIMLTENGFSFLVDKNGSILAMPEQGYAAFGLQPEEIPINESPKQTILDTKSNDLQQVTQRIMSGETGLFIAKINAVENYVAIASLKTSGYRLAAFAPAKELNQEIVSAREDVQKEVQSSLRSATAILIAMFVAALIFSLWIGSVITRPMKRLTRTVEQIANGDISARVEVSSQDETGILARSFNIMVEKLNDTLLSLEERISERTKEVEKISESNAYRASQFESIAHISRTISSTQTLDALLPQITETISERLGFYHVGIFLLDARKEYAILVAANSSGGKRMLARSHRLHVGETGIVGNVTKTGQPRLALDVGHDAVFFNNPDLPETRSEIALPLRIGSNTFGAIDVQSTKSKAFTQEDVNILSTLSELVGIAIQNARSYQESREALAQAEIVSSQLSEQQWSRFLSRQTIGGYHFDGIEAKQLKPSSQDGTAHAQSLTIPLTLRGTRIGTLKLNATDPNRVWTEEEIALAHATAERTALAIENARLLQDAQKRAAKERTIGEISSKIGSLVNLENIVQTTIQELGSTLPGTEIAIQFTQRKPRQKESPGAPDAIKDI